MKNYTIYLKHDKGKISLNLMADSIDQAVKAIMAYENCPERAIYKIEVREVAK